MLRFLIRRLARALVALIAFQTILFLLIQALPGDYASLTPGSSLRKQALRTLLGLDTPVWQQYLLWMKNFFTGNLGTSFQTPRPPVLHLLLASGPRTLLLFLPAALLAFGLGLWLGKHIAWRRGRWPEWAATFIGIAGYTSFAPWLGFVLIQLFALKLRWLPVENLINANRWRGASVLPNTVVTWIILSAMLNGIPLLGWWWLTRRRSRFHRWTRPVGGAVLLSFTLGLWLLSGWAALALDILHHLALPLITLILLSFGEAMLLMRTSMIEYLGEDHVLTAHAKGLPEAEIRDRHVARLALLPVLARIVLQLPFVLIGGFVIERVFYWQGVGQIMFEAADNQNLPVLMGVLSLVGVGLLIAHCLLDILNAWLDPRLRDKATQAQI
jgi:peptide/nickel transport system permease protein